jgi:phenylpyruvate tautomerase PptA (4-oxalocrotonate tautomerase family)
MPLYTVSTPTPIPQNKKQRIAKGFTDTHCEITGAPAQFVQVLFFHGIKIDKKQVAYVTGSIRSGRDASTKNKIIAGFKKVIIDAFKAEQTNGLVDSENVTVILQDVPAKWAIEGGAIMPEPGQEAEWLEKNSI